MTANQKPNIFQRFAQWIRRIIQETVGELRKVSWPSRQEALNLTKIVLAVLFFMGLILGAWDYLVSLIFRLLLTA